MSPGLSRRRMLKLGVVGSTGLIGASLMGNAVLGQDAETPAPTADPYSTELHDATGTHVDMSEMLMGTVDPENNGFDPMQMLVDWDYGTTSQLEDGRTLREYNVEAGDIEIQIAPGLYFPAWAFNARVPGPTLRCTEGDHLQVHFSNYGTHPHTMHFHGFHTADMDGIPHVGRGQILPGENFTYEFDADPFGCHLYHCHATPLKRHLHKGMYGAFIIDPKEGRPPAREFMMMMNAFDTNFDGENEIYAVNTVGHEFMHRPIPVKVGELVRIYLINVIEFDLINSFHLHANFFDYYDTGTTLQPTLRTVDTIMQAQGQRGILEFRFRWPGKYMFHAHVSEFAELGWMGFFNAVQPEDFKAAMSEVGVDEEWDYKGTQDSRILSATNAGGQS